MTLIKTINKTMFIISFIVTCPTILSFIYFCFFHQNKIIEVWPWYKSLYPIISSVLIINLCWDIINLVILLYPKLIKRFSGKYRM